MPTYRGISVTLHSQFDLEIIPEYFPKPSAHYTLRNLPVPETILPLVDEEARACNAYIPVYPGSTFWIEYAALPPVPEDQHFFFKLFIDGASIVSWGVGKDRAWKGKTMFALFEKEIENGKKIVEKRVLAFTTPKRDGEEAKGEDVKGKGKGNIKSMEDTFGEETVLELRVHRAHARVRAQRELSDYGESEHSKKKRGISLNSAGRAGPEQPKRFYQYALIDPVDKPFAAFRFHYRTWDQIRDMDLLEQDASEADDLSIIEPYSHLGIEDPLNEDDEQEHEEERKGVNEDVESDRETVLSNADSKDHRRAVDDSQPARPSTANTVSSSKAEQYDSSSRLVTSPAPQDDTQSTESSAVHQQTFPVDKWTTRTPSPIQSTRDSISTPTMKRKKSRDIINAITGPWRRRGQSASDASTEQGAKTIERGASASGVASASSHHVVE